MRGSGALECMIFRHQFHTQVQSRENVHLIRGGRPHKHVHTGTMNTAFQIAVQMIYCKVALTSFLNTVASSRSLSFSQLGFTLGYAFSFDTIMLTDM